MAPTLAAGRRPVRELEAGLFWFYNARGGRPSALDQHPYRAVVSVAEILAPSRVAVSNAAEGVVRDKRTALERLATLLSSGGGADEARLLGVLEAREKLQSTGVGGGVAVPHGSVDELDRQIGALLVCPTPIPFDAIDGEPVSIIFALVGPKGAPAEHLKILARVSRLLRNQAFRAKLTGATSGIEAYELISSSDRGGA